MRRWVWALVYMFVVASGAAAAPLPAVDFNRQIRPILSNNCYTCHGPDSHQRKADLRLDNSDDAHAKHKNGTPFFNADVSKSEVIALITSADDDERMPPVKSGKKLTAEQISLLKQWVAQGAKYEKHWAFIAPQPPEIPAVKNPAWCRNEIDRFILARLDAEGLKPSPEADKATLCRRLYFDLLGLPPTPKQVDEFVGDTSADAYERLVDRLLANPHFGERMALDWLDASRFADTHGYHIDAGRDQSRWRDWVINAFNTNKPFDQFTVEQLAGDLLPGASDEQKIATGFVRNNMINFEGGAIPEEYLTAYLMDRVNTTSMVWLGLTLNCCQCHDHKFDPFTQKNYYQMYAFFNGVPESGLDGRTGNAAPLLSTPTPTQRARLAEIAGAISAIESRSTAPMPEMDEAQAAWEKEAARNEATQWTILEPAEMKSAEGATLKSARDHSISVSGSVPTNDTFTITAPPQLTAITAIRLEALPAERLKAKGPGRSENGNVVLTDIRIKSGVNSDAPQAHSFKTASADYSQKDFPVASAIDDDAKSGWAIFPEVGKSHWAVFEFSEPLHATASSALTVTLAFNSGFAGHQLAHFRLSVTNSKNPHAGETLPANIRQALAVAADRRNPSQKAELQKYFRLHVSSAMRPERDNLEKLTKEKAAIEKAMPTTMVMAEMPKPRDTFILIRGQYDKHGDQVSADVPESLAPLPANAPHNRLALARWLVSPEQPLTSRVIVNRYWQSLFGTGIVKTVEDFGSQGEEPTHPELLDWLAVHFQGSERPWDVKGIIKLMVMSSMYRQRSTTTPEILARDPENRLLSHMSRFRLPAEFIRDEALSVSGLLSDEIGGKSVSPYQPAGLWEELMKRSDGANWTAQTYVQDHGKDLYKRTMYTFWKRTSPPPTLATFDAPDRETCTVRRARTNTPLQALVLMNDPTYVESARKLAERMMTEAGKDDEARITFAFKLATARAPSAAEVAVLKRINEKQLAVFHGDPSAAKKLLGVGESPVNEKLDPIDLAAWTNVASVVLNLDETITKG